MEFIFFLMWLLSCSVCRVRMQACHCHQADPFCPEWIANPPGSIPVWDGGMWKTHEWTVCGSFLSYQPRIRFSKHKVGKWWFLYRLGMQQFDDNIWQYFNLFQWSPLSAPLSLYLRRHWWTTPFMILWFPMVMSIT